MPFTSITKPATGTATLKSLIDAVIDNLVFLYNSFLSLVGSRETIINGSFESDADADGFPDGWTRTLYTGGTFSHETSTAAADGKAVHGKRSVKFTSPGGVGNGGGYVESTDFFECSESRTYILTWQSKSSVAGIHNLVEIVFYDSTQTVISTSNLYDSTANPTAWTIHCGAIKPPANSRYAKVRFTGAKNDNTTAGSAWFDNVQIATTIPETVVVYDASTTFVVPANITRIRVRAWGAGGDGSATTSGGGAGGYGEDVFAVTPGSSHTVTIGAGGAPGGNTSLGSLITANGGTAGSGGTPGTGGTSAATINVTGGSGEAPGRGGSAGGGGGDGGKTTGGAGRRPGGGGGGGSGAGAGGRIIIEYGAIV